MLADDVDRWVLRIDGSRQMALAVRAMKQPEAYRTLLSMDSRLTPTPAIERALERVASQLAESFDIAVATRHVTAVPDADLVVVAAECDDYAGEIADRWKDDYDCAVFALYDHRGDCISFRRSPACSVDLSRLAARFGGGGHPAAAGCNMTTTGNDRFAQITRRIVDALSHEAAS
jgi:oligoribonuclease NrnB/cAMP/cGMP phosphodiesterase (DHH superfamily)